MFDEFDSIGQLSPEMQDKWHAHLSLLTRTIGAHSACVYIQYGKQKYFQIFPELRDDSNQLNARLYELRSLLYHFSSFADISSTSGFTLTEIKLGFEKSKACLCIYDESAPYNKIYDEDLLTFFAEFFAYEFRNVCKELLTQTQSNELPFANKINTDNAASFQNSKNSIQNKIIEEQQNYNYTRSLIEASLDPLVTINTSGKITDVNTATERATGLRREELIETDFCEYFTEPGKAREGYKRAFDVGFVIDYPLTLRSADNKHMDVLYNASVYRDQQGNVMGVFAAARDITFRKQAEQIIQQQNSELRKLNADKDRYFSILSHDLRSPFNSLLGFSELLLLNLRKYDLDKIESFLTYIHDTHQHTFNLLNDLLLWSKSQSGAMPYEPAKLHLNQVCNEVIDEKKATAHMKEIEIILSPALKPWVIADVNMLKTILRNLTSNAIKFTPRKGQIHIFTEMSDNTLRVCVKDSGIGITPSQQTLLWDFAAPHTTNGTENEKGTGLGLVLCKEFIEKHGGEIWVESIVNEGSIFKFTLRSVSE